MRAPSTRETFRKSGVTGVIGVTEIRLMILVFTITKTFWRQRYEIKQYVSRKSQTQDKPKIKKFRSGPRFKGLDKKEPFLKIKDSLISEKDSLISEKGSLILRS